ncbi:MAG: exo-alpha-sialidase, partial [Planctomycetales bacterium]|nr:exo-alpha-sialidase [Planctomycetales bacterium]
MNTRVGLHKTLCLLRALLCLSLLAISRHSAHAETALSQNPVYTAGESGVHTYRIPSLVAAPDGTLLAFCEARNRSRSDAGDIDLVVKRSTDNGNTWSHALVLWDDGPNTCGNPCAVVDRATGVVWLLMTWNSGVVHESKIQPGFGEDSRRVFVTHSDDNGQSWEPPREITRQVKPAAWSWYATGPGAGIQLERGEHRGRLVIPCDHGPARTESKRSRSHVIYSDDHGATWQLGGSVIGDTNESEVVELSDGRLMLNMRNSDRTQDTRLVATSEDGGENWSAPSHDDTLVEPICQASIRRMRWEVSESPSVILFSNPATRSKRRHLTVRASYDDGQTWPVARRLHSGGSAYSCLCSLPDGAVGCLYERDDYA